jgi:biotin transport system substrate-specific component
MYNTIVLDREITHRKSVNAVIGVLFFVLATALGAYVRIPVPGSPVPITLQTFFVVLSGAVLGKRLGIASQAAYIFLGASGLPIFQGYAFGTAHILGPTGGYLAGFMVASFLVGKMLESETSNPYKIVSAFVIGNAVLYASGVLWLVLLYRISLASAIAIGVLPFLAVEAFKILMASVLYQKISHRSKSIFS